MILRIYWQTVKKRLWLVLGLPLLVIATYPVLSSPPTQTYAASMRFVVGIQPEPGSSDYYSYDRYYTWLTAEYLVDDLSEVVKSRRFADDVATAAGVAVPTGAIQGATYAGKLHRILSVTVTWPDTDQLGRIASAIETVLTENAHTYFAQMGTDHAVVRVIDPASLYPIGRSLADRLDLPLRALLALLVGLGLAFLLDYLDDSVQSHIDVEGLGVDVLAEVPTMRRLIDRVIRRHTMP